MNAQPASICKRKCPYQHVGAHAFAARSTVWAAGAVTRRRSKAAAAGSGSSAKNSPLLAATKETTRLKMTVAYDGTDFSGFQFQAPPARTVQGELERAAARVLLPASRVVGAGRTDGGAHAVGQVAHLDAAGGAASFDVARLRLHLNGVLPADVKVAELELAPPGFDAHFSSAGKEYAYRLYAGAAPSPHAARGAWWVYDRWCDRARGKPGAPDDIALDVPAMRAAAALLLGEHDFTTFADKKRPAGLGRLKKKKPKLVEMGVRPQRTREKNTRRLWRCDVIEEPPPEWPPSAASASAAAQGGEQQQQQQQEQVGADGSRSSSSSRKCGGFVRLELEGSGFLYRMVRLIAAGLVEVGHGRISPSQLAAALAAGDRAALPVEAAPAGGLYLVRVHYPAEGSGSGGALTEGEGSAEVTSGSSDADDDEEDEE